MKEYFGPVPVKTPFWCRFGFHQWCHQGGFDEFDFCDICGIVRRW